MKPGSLVEIFDLTSVFKTPWQKIGMILGKSDMQKTKLHYDCDGMFDDVIWWDVLLNGKHYRLPNYRLRRIE